MENTALNTTLFENLGKVFYAIANADRNLHENEIARLKAEIEKYWKPIFAEAPYSMAYYIWHAFERCRSNKLAADKAFEEFALYFEQEPGPFTAEIRQLILDTANAIAAAYADKNKSELILLAKLQLLLK
ncbi:MAG: hypothetical protein HKP23_01600 [Flavobacteriaceae bacterium]|nr:hypothetical protein [Eudoraea sp.]NNJ37917.1 hypothetical protein [Flavobacteriaceae bacterium]